MQPFFRHFPARRPSLGGLQRRFRRRVVEALGYHVLQSRGDRFESVQSPLLFLEPKPEARVEGRRRELKTALADRGIRVYSVGLGTLDGGLLTSAGVSTIDKAIPSPILFMIKFNGKSQLVSCFKTLSTDKKKIIIGSYFKSDWIADNSERVKLPVALNMDGLYHQMLTSLSPVKKRKNETIEDWAQRYENLQSKLQEADRLEQKVNKEKQFNRRVELNHKLNTLKSEIKELEE